MIPFMITFWASGSVTPPSAGSPLFLENIPRHNISRSITINGTSVSFCPLTNPQSFVLNQAYFGMMIQVSTTFSFNFTAALYSLNGSTLSRFNQFTRSFSYTGATGVTTFQTWVSMVLSAASTLAAGQYWLGLYFNPINNQPKFGTLGLAGSLAYTGSNPAYARMSVSTAAMPASVAISDLTQFSEGTRLPYVLLTA